MTKKQTIAVAKLYDERLAGLRPVAPARLHDREGMDIDYYELSSGDPDALAELRPPLGDLACAHMRWMTSEIIKFVERAEASGTPCTPLLAGPRPSGGVEAGEGELAKANRWLGFMQGVLWRSGIYTLDELREHNRSVEADQQGGG